MGKTCWFVSALAVAVLFLGSSLGTAQDLGLGEKCPDETKLNPLTVCSEFIHANYQNSSDLIIGMRDAIDAKKDLLRNELSFSRHYDRWMQGALIILTFLTTVATAIARIYRDSEWGKRIEVGLYPIVLSALVTLVANFNAYYRFDDTQDRYQIATNELAKLQTDFDYYLIESVAKGDNASFEPATVADWKARFDKIISRYMETPSKEGSKDQTS